MDYVLWTIIVLVGMYVAIRLIFTEVRKRAGGFKD